MVLIPEKIVKVYKHFKNSYSFTSGKKSVIGAYVTDFKDNMEDMNNSHSSAYSSLTNSTNEINDHTTIIQSPPPGMLGMSTTVSSEGTHKNLKKQSAGASYGYNSYHRSPSSHQYQDDVTDVSNIPVIHDGYNSTASSVSGIGSTSEQKISRSSRDLTSRISCATPPTSTSIEIRNIIDDYNATLRRATKEIKGLTRDKSKLEVEYEKLLTINETLATDLGLAIRHKKNIKEEQENILKANEELYEEAQRLNNEEAAWIVEKEELQVKATELSKKLAELDTKQCVSEAIAAKQTKIAEQYKRECERDHIPTIAKVEAENKHLQMCLGELEEEHDIVLSRKEKAAGENMQLIMESEDFTKKKAELSYEIKDWKAKHKELERENGRLKIQLDMSMSPSKSASSLQEEKYAKMLEQNKNLTEWREQLIRKNAALTEENTKLHNKCAGLEALLNEEETDINDVLEIIRTMQKTGGLPPGSGPISPMSAIGAKLRELNHK